MRYWPDFAAALHRQTPIESCRSGRERRWREEGRIEVAQNLLANGLGIKQVARCTGFDWEAVTRLGEAD